MSPDAALLLELFGRFALLSLLSIGGAITVAPEMHRLLVERNGWITDAQFTASISIAQAAPGPNILFVSVLGWQVAGATGCLATTVGIMLPSATLAMWVSRRLGSLAHTRGVRAFKAGLAPVVIGLVAATGWVLAQTAAGDAVLLATLAGAFALAAFTRIGPLWLIAGGALAGIASA